MFSVHSKQQKSLVKSLENISTSLLKEMKALNVYQINLIRTLKFMHKTKYGINPIIFIPKFREVDHKHPIRFSQNSF